MQDLNQEINSLRNTVIQHLQANGTLAKLRASLRSEVYQVAATVLTPDRGRPGKG
jgi:hypothetical protein